MILEISRHNNLVPLLHLISKKITIIASTKYLVNH